MSFYSSIKILYPGASPKLTVEQLLAFCLQVHAAALTDDGEMSVAIKYGHAIDQDYETIDQANWTEVGNVMIGDDEEIDWDFECDGGDWEALWPRGRR